MTDMSDMTDLQLEDVEDYSADYPPSEGYPNAEANMAPAGTMDETSTKPRNYRRTAVISLIRNNKIAFAVFGIALIALIGLLATTVGAGERGSASAANSSNDEDYSVGVPPEKVFAKQVKPDVLTKFKTTLKNTFDRHNLDQSVLEQEDTPQSQAMIWMCKDKNVNSIEHTEKLQRYVLAVLFYSTNMIPSMHVQDPRAWKVADKWMTNAHSCDWMGIQCNEDKVITAIFLEKNRLSGKIPKEISIIANNIETLDFTDNIMHMRGDDFDALLSLKNLHTLLMDDNFLFNDSGLPSQFGSLTSLRKLRLSYNVFEGQMDKHSVLGSMKKLTHLEVESNYFNGTMPSAIANLDQLTYLYLRRNDMKFNMDFVKFGQYKENLFAMWLDGNDIFGTIPTELGSFSGLASLSLANTTLTGKIPTELGNLHQLQRLWLFGNKLTGSIPPQLNKLNMLEVLELHSNNLQGSMPKGVCSHVSESDYKYKSLTSDCVKKVTCGSDCCTSCF